MQDTELGDSWSKLVPGKIAEPVSSRFEQEILPQFIKWRTMSNRTFNIISGLAQAPAAAHMSIYI